jgi:hypothetical protein
VRSRFTEMNQQTAETVANAVLVCAAVAGAYVVLRTPPLRRLAWRLTRVLLMSTLPAYLSREVRAAWVASGQEPYLQQPVGPRAAGLP